ncbi:MAG: type II secretion system protein [Massilia sp.]
MRQLDKLACRRERGFSLAEFAVVAIVVALLAGTLLQRLVMYQEEAEKAAAMRMVGTLRAALALRVAHLHASGRDAEVAALAGQNPIEWLSERPQNYAGEYFDPAPPGIPYGNWYFNRSNKSVIYLLHQRKFFPQSMIHQLQYAVKLLHSPEGNDQSPAKTTPAVALMEVEG